MPKTRKKSERRGDVEEADQARLAGRWAPASRDPGHGWLAGGLEGRPVVLDRGHEVLGADAPADELLEGARQVVVHRVARPVLVVDQAVIGRDRVPGIGHLLGDRVAGRADGAGRGRDAAVVEVDLALVGVHDEVDEARREIRVGRLAGDVERQREGGHRDDLVQG